MKKEFLVPEFEKIELEVDVIRTSGEPEPGEHELPFQPVNSVNPTAGGYGQ